MTVGKQTLETVSAVVAFLAEEKIETILAHPTTFSDVQFALEALIFFMEVILRLQNSFHVVVCPMCFRFLS